MVLGDGELEGKNEKRVAGGKKEKTNTKQQFRSAVSFIKKQLAVVRWRQVREKIKKVGGGKEVVASRAVCWTAVDVETGNQWERKCAESREQET